MARLHAVSSRSYDATEFVGRVTTNPDRPAVLREREVLLSASPSHLHAPGFLSYLLREPEATAEGAVLDLPPALSYLGDGDVIKVRPRTGSIIVLYRRTSDSNTLLLTEQCNSACIMCCQPPKPGDDDRTEEVLRTIELIHPATRELGLSGGEPTLHLDGLLRVVQKAKNYLPVTALHLLSNARAFKYLHAAERLACLRHPDLVVGIPIHADIADLHDWISQQHGAFDETVLGMMNLSRCGIRVEVRVVLHRQNASRIAPIAFFIGRNLAFSSHIAFMGMEVHGWALARHEDLWIDPVEYRSDLRQGVRHLASLGLNVSIFNHPLCILDSDLWEFARQSISDWKVLYLPACESCQVRHRCGGVFATSHGYHSAAISPVRYDVR